MAPLFLSRVNTAMALDPRTFLTNPVVRKVAASVPGGNLVVQASDTLQELEDCPPSLKGNRATIGCPSNYAIDLIERAPKHKFMFVLQVVVEPPFNEVFPPDVCEDLTFVVKRSGRPNVNVDYEEVNLYNYRTKVAKRIEYQPITVGFYDDIQSGALEFLRRYLEVTSPSARIGAQTGLYKSFEELGMEYADNSDGDGNTTTSGHIDGFSLFRNSGLTERDTTIISYINLYHIYSGGTFVDVYTFAKPKITEIQLDDLDMTTSGEGSEIAFTFSYDALNIETKVRAGQLRSRIQDLTDAGRETLNVPRSLDNPLTNGGLIGGSIPGVQAAANIADGATELLQGGPTNFSDIANAFSGGGGPPSETQASGELQGDNPTIE